MATKDSIKKLLAAGFPVPQVADMLRLKTEFIDTLLKQDKAFAVEVEQAITQRAMGSIDRDDRIDGLHDKVIGMLEENIEYMTKPALILKAFSIINGAKKESDAKRAEGNSLGNGAKVVNIILPPHLLVHAVHHEVNANNEVIVVEDTPMVTMNSKTVAELVNKAKAEEVKAKESTFKLNGRTFSLSDLDLFDDKVGVINQNMHNLDFVALKRAADREAAVNKYNVDAEEAEFYTEMSSSVINGMFIPAGCVVFKIDEDLVPQETEEELQKLFDACQEANRATGMTKIREFINGQGS